MVPAAPLGKPMFFISAMFDFTDFFSFEAADNGLLHASLSNLNDDIDLYLYSDQGELLSYSINEGSDSESLSYYLMKNKRYLVNVTPYQNAESVYSLDLFLSEAEEDASDFLFSTTIIDPPVSIRQTVGFDNDIADFFLLSPDLDGVLDLRLTDLSADIDLYLYDSRGNRLTYSDFSGSSPEQILYNVQANSIYYIGIEPYQKNRSEYLLSIDLGNMTSESDNNRVSSRRWGNAM